jgi:hypothetical protein
MGWYTVDHVGHRLCQWTSDRRGILTERIMAVDLLAEPPLHRHRLRDGPPLPATKLPPQLNGGQAPPRRLHRNHSLRQLYHLLPHPRNLGRRNVFLDLLAHPRPPARRILGLIAFILYEIYIPQEPLIRLSIFCNRTTVLAYLTTLLHGTILWCLLYYLPLYFEAVKSYSPILSGIALFPKTFTVAPAGLLMGLLITFTGKYRWSILLGWALTTLGLGLLLLLFDVDTHTTKWIFLMLPSGVGMGILFPAMQFAIQGSSLNKDLAFAVALFSFFRNFGQALGVAVGGTIFQNQMKRKLLALPRWAGRAEALAKDSAALVQPINAMPPRREKRDLQVVYAQSFRVIIVVLGVLAGVSLVLSWFIQGYDLDRPLETEQGFVEEGEKVCLESGGQERREKKTALVSVRRVEDSEGGVLTRCIYDRQMDYMAAW